MKSPVSRPSGTRAASIRLPKGRHRFFSLWSINGPLDRKNLHRQLVALRHCGLEGVVFHPRNFPNLPVYLGSEYLQIVSEVILDAKSLDLGFWIYDENGWPSGSANGRLFSERPQDVATRLDLFRKAGSSDVTSFTHGGATWHLAPQRVHGLDCFNPAACRRFLEDIHEKYRKGLAPEAFDYVEAFFTDEPESGASWEPMPRHGGVPWSSVLLERLEEVAGPDARRKLPRLFFPGPGARDFRVLYWELVADLIVEGFFKPYRKWCEKWGKILVGHVKGEEHPLFQIPMVGSCQTTHRALSVPGIDALERYPSNDFFPRQGATVAAQFGNGRAMVECFGGAGWGARPEDLERYLLWLGRNGITDFAMHLSQFQLDSNAIRDWPPSQPLHLTWKGAYAQVLRRVRETLEREGPLRADTLVVAPFRGIMAEYDPAELLETNIHNGSIYPDSIASRINRAFLAQLEQLSRDGVVWHVVDERTFEEGRLVGGKLRLGKCRYTRVRIAKGARLNPAGKRLAQELKTSGLDVMPSPGVGKKSSRTPGSFNHSLVHPLAWNVHPPEKNHLLLELKPEGDRWFAGSFESAADDLGGEMEILLADPALEVVLNGRTLESGKRNDLISVLVPAGLVAQSNQVRIRFCGEVHQPYVWLGGHFRVLSRGFFTEGLNGTVQTPGPFYLEESGSIKDAGRLVEDGYPFLNQPISASSRIVFPQPISGWRFDGVVGDALRVAVDGKIRGWVWGPDWELHFDTPLPEGGHILHLELIPSTYNFFGPHHYYRGDAPVVSPGQFAGVKNFADPPKAPKQTHIPAWHFKPLALPDCLLSQTQARALSR